MSESLDREMARFGKKLAVYLKANLDEAIINGSKGRGNPQEPKLNFYYDVVATSDGIKVQIMATGEYWSYIEYGVDGTKKKHGSPYKYRKKFIDFDAVGKRWQEHNGINPKKVLLEIEAKYRKKSRLSVVNNKLSRVKKTLSHDEAAYKLSKYFAFAIARDGLTPKPFVQQAIKEAKVDEFQKKISEAMGQDIRIQLELNNTVTPIKLNF